MSSKVVLPVKVIAHTGKMQTGTVIFLHGSGDTGTGIHNWVSHLVKDFTFPHLKILFPSAPARPYTPSHGALSNVWFDRKEISKRVPEDLPSINFMAKEIVRIIDNEVNHGISVSNIVIGGFSMGGAMAFHVGYRVLPQLAGVFALSGFVNDNSIVFDQLKAHGNANLPPLFQWHGARDDLVPLGWGKETFESLQSLGVKGEFHTGNNSFHELERRSLEKLHSWILDKVPE